MDFNIAWWIWLVVAAAFLLVEMLTTTFFGLWMAIAAAVPAFLSLALPELSVDWQIVAWIIAIVLCAFLWVKISRKRTPSGGIGESLIGEVGLLSRASSTNLFGVIVLQKPIEGRVEWKCVSDEDIPASTRVIILEKIGDDLLRVALASSVIK